MLRTTIITAFLIAFLNGCGGGGGNAPIVTTLGIDPVEPEPEPEPEPEQEAVEPEPETITAFALAAFRCQEHYGEGFDCDSYSRDAFDQDNIPTYNIDTLPARTRNESGLHQPIYHDHSQLYGIGVHDWDEYRRIFVGLDIAPENLPVVTTRREIKIGHGVVNDGVDKATLASYLSEAVGETAVRWDVAPSVTLLGQPTQDQINWFHATVELVNATLPESSRMRIVSPSSNATITIEFRDWREFPEGVGGTTWNTFDTDSNGNKRIIQSIIRIDEVAFAIKSHRHFITLLAHEFLHSLGLHHVSADFDTIMETTREVYRSWQGYGIRYESDEHGNPVAVSGEGLEAEIPLPMSIVYPIDRAALQILYGRLNNGDDVASFGSWATASLHIAGSSDNVKFGVANNNGHVAPWAHGYMPSRVLSESATWSGNLVGFTPDNAAIIGNAAINVNIATMSGRANFTDLERWPVNIAPGVPGTGTTWLDGDLAYNIAVHSNTFRETGGDNGRLTGAFTGSEHQGAVGTLERDDLIAAFGTIRE